MKTERVCRCRARGFTLIELIVAVAVVTILLTIAYPVYREQMMQGRRADGRALLLAAAQNEQRFFSRNNSYTTNVTTDLNMSALSPDGFYTLTVAPGPTGSITTSYRLTAAPTTGTPQTADSGCGSLTLDSLGVQGRTGSLPIERCW